MQKLRALVVSNRRPSGSCQNAHPVLMSQTRIDRSLPAETTKSSPGINLTAETEWSWPYRVLVFFQSSLESHTFIVISEEQDTD